MVTSGSLLPGKCWQLVDAAWKASLIALCSTWVNVQFDTGAAMPLVRRHDGIWHFQRTCGTSRTDALLLLCSTA
jgi:hypothetical protein